MSDIPCIKCGETGTVRVDLQTGEDLYCSACDGEYTAADVREAIGAWEAVLGWLAAHPANAAEPAKAVSR